jgi:hypothetical protein
LPEPLVNPEPIDQDDGGQFLIRQRRAAQLSAMQGLEDNPDDAARAGEIAQSTGADPRLVYGNLDEYQQQHKAALTSALLAGNPRLIDYVNSHPLADKVSNDDWGQLDKISDTIGNAFTHTRDIAKTVGSALGHDLREGYKSGVQEFGDQPLLMPYDPPSPQNRAEFAMQRGLNYPLGYGIRNALDLYMRGLSAATMGTASTLGSLVEQMGIPGARTVAETGAQALMDPGFWASLPPLEGVPVGQAVASIIRGIHDYTGRPITPENIKQIEDATKQVENADRVSDPWARAGVEPPAGLNNLTDQGHDQQIKMDMDGLDAIQKETQKSTTIERSPQSYSAFLDAHPEIRGRNALISPEGIEKLYPEDKLPEAGDGKLGDVPDISAKIQAARADGGDVGVPVRDLVQLEPEVYRDLHDFIRTRKGGFTLEDGKEERNTTFEDIGTYHGLAELDQNPSIDQRYVDTANAVEQAARLKLRSLEKLEAALAKLPTFQNERQELWGTHYQIIPRKEFFDNEVKIIDAVNAEIEKLFPTGKGPRIGAARELGKVSEKGDRPVQGLFSTSLDHDFAPVMLWSMKADSPLGTVRHEAIHALYRMGFFKQSEWDALQNAAEKGDWVGKHDIAPRYKDPNVWLEEAIAEEFKHWRDSYRPGHVASGVFGRILELFRSIHRALRSVLGFEPTADDLFRRVEAGEIGAREPTMPMGPMQARITLGQEEERPKLPAAIGQTLKENKKYQELISKENEETLKYRQKIAERAERERQTQAWKDNEGPVREEAARDLQSRPDIAVDRFLREGNLYGDKVRRVRLDGSKLTQQQKEMLSPEHYGAQGLDPDDLASRFGYHSGDALVAALTRLEKERQREDLTPTAYFNQLRDIETERRMRERYGSLEENILQAAKDHVFSPTLMERIHEEMLAIGQAAHGRLLDISKEDVKAWAKKSFDSLPLEDHDSDKYLATVGRIGRKVEQALLEEKPTDAFKFAQQRAIQAHYARFALDLEKLRASHENMVRPLLRATSERVPGEYMNWIHQILARTGYNVRRLESSVRDAINRRGEKTLQEFVASKNYDKEVYSDDELSTHVGQQMPVAHFLFDDGYNKPVGKMLPPEFKAYSDSIKTLVHNGRMESRVDVQGKKEALRDLIDNKMIPQMQRAMGEGKELSAGLQPKKLTSAIGASLLRVENWFNRLDLDNPRGVHNQAIIRKMFDRANYLAKLEKEFDKKFRELWDYVPSNKKIDNDLFIDPATNGLMDLRDHNLMAILQNAGNKLQQLKLFTPYGVKVERGMQWLFQHTTKADWDRSQRLGDFFNEIFELSQLMYEDLSGVAPDKIDLEPIHTPFGTYRGWYHPLVADPMRGGTSARNLGDLIEESGFYRPTTPAGYTKARTGALYPILLDFSAIPFKIKTMLNDIAMRPAITDIAKIFYDQKFKSAFARFFGEQYREELIPWLRDAAGQRAYITPAQRFWLVGAEAVRENIINQLIGLNPGTVMKHGMTAGLLSMREVGIQSFWREFVKLYAHDPVTGERNYQFAIRNSEELQRRMRTWVETITGGQVTMFQPMGKLATMREMMQYFGAFPVAISDFASAVPTWLAKYRDVANEVGHGEAVFEADRAVRRAHGSTATVARPGIMRAGGFVNYLVPFYNFFNTILNLKYEMAWKAKLVLEKRALDGKGITDISPDGIITLNPRSYRDLDNRALEFKGGASKIPHILGGVFVGSIAVAAIEQLVDPIDWPQGESAWKHFGKVLGYGEATSYPIGRDVINTIMRGASTSAGIYTTTFEKIKTFFGDLERGKQSMSPEHAGKTIRDFNSLFGILTGLTNEEIGKVGQYVTSIVKGKEHPRTAVDIYRGIRRGTQVERKAR